MASSRLVGSRRHNRESLPRNAVLRIMSSVLSRYRPMRRPVWMTIMIIRSSSSVDKLEKWCGSRKAGTTPYARHARPLRLHFESFGGSRPLISVRWQTLGRRGSRYDQSLGERPTVDAVGFPRLVRSARFDIQSFALHVYLRHPTSQP